MNQLDRDSLSPWFSNDESRDIPTHFHDTKTADLCDLSEEDFTPYDWNTCHSPPRKRRMRGVESTFHTATDAIPASLVVTPFDSFSPFGNTRFCRALDNCHEEAFLLSELVATEHESLQPSGWFDHPPLSSDASTRYSYDSDRHQLTPSPESIGRTNSRLHERLAEQAALSSNEHVVHIGFQGAPLLPNALDGAKTFKTTQRTAALSITTAMNISIEGSPNSAANILSKEVICKMKHSAQVASTPPTFPVKEVTAMHVPTNFPVPFSSCMDTKPLSRYQVFLVRLVEVFEASDDDVHTYVKGRNKSVKRGQVGLRCRHCANLSVAYRSRGSTYFPSAMVGIYQAAQNMSKNHVAICTELPEEDRKRYEIIVPKKPTSSKTGKKYWAKCAQTLGLMDTDEGIFRIKTETRKSNIPL